MRSAQSPLLVLRQFLIAVDQQLCYDLPDRTIHLENKMDRPTIIITGASRGIGAASALIAAEKGAQVVLTARTRSALETQARLIEQRGGSVLVVEGDISRQEDCHKIIAQTIQKFGRIDAVINNAAWIGPIGLVAEVQPEDWTRALEINLFGLFRMCHEAVPYLRQTNGKVVNISSGVAVWAAAGGSAYCSSKAALNQFSKVLAVEEPDITVVMFDPGSTDTPMQAELREKGNVKAFEAYYQFFVDLYEQGELRPPEVASLDVVALAMAAPHAWTGKFIRCDDKRMQKLVKKFLSSSNPKV